MLFAPPQPPVSLPREGEGSVSGAAASARCACPTPTRRGVHAKIVLRAARALQLAHASASTNGTFRERRAHRAARAPAGRPGSRSARTRGTFCQVSGGLDQPDDAATTVLFERSVCGRGFSGATSPRSRRSRCLPAARYGGARRDLLTAIDFRHDAGKLWLRGGDPIHAETKSQGRLRRAVAPLVIAAAGRLRVRAERAASGSRRIEASVTHLLLEASRQLDRGNGRADARLLLLARRRRPAGDGRELGADPVAHTRRRPRPCPCAAARRAPGR
jgi:hypothetical protein